MKFKFLYTILLFTVSYLSVYSQETVSSYCNFETDGNGASKGLKFKLSYPCNYNVQDAIQDKNTVKKFSYQFGKIVISLSIDKFPSKEMDRDFKANFTIQSFKKILEIDGEVQHISNINIDSVTTIEAIWTELNTDMQEDVFFTKYLSNFIYYKGYFIILMYGINGFDESEVNETFSTLLSDFREMALASAFLN